MGVCVKEKKQKKTEGVRRELSRGNAKHRPKHHRLRSSSSSSPSSALSS
uniref:Uncharacterized protein n=1 Tax=Syphacia muris TaxID=451379 RepID=A0A0N5AH80_9BILA